MDLGAVAAPRPGPGVEVDSTWLGVDSESQAWFEGGAYVRTMSGPGMQVVTVLAERVSPTKDRHGIPFRERVGGTVAPRPRGSQRRKPDQSQERQERARDSHWFSCPEHSEQKSPPTGLHSE